MNGDKPGEAKADKWRETFERNRRDTDGALTRLEVRAEMKSSGEEELSSVIDQRTLEAQRRKESEPPASGYSKHAVWLIKSVKGWPQALFGLGVLALAAWYMWLHK